MLKCFVAGKFFPDTESLQACSKKIVQLAPNSDNVLNVVKFQGLVYDHCCSSYVQFSVYLVEEGSTDKTSPIPYKRKQYSLCKIRFKI